MGYVTREMIDRAKEMDLLTYLQTYEPQELVHFGGSTYCTREHDSLKISNGKWCWFSRGIGGRTALDYLIKVKEVPFTEAVERIVGRAAERPPISNARQQPEQTKALLLMRRASPGRANAGMNGRAKSVWYALGLLPAVWLGLLVPRPHPADFLRSSGSSQRRCSIRFILSGARTAERLSSFLPPPMVCWWEWCCPPGATTGGA